MGTTYNALNIIYHLFPKGENTLNLITLLLDLQYDILPRELHTQKEVYGYDNDHYLIRTKACIFIKYQLPKGENTYN